MGAHRGELGGASLVRGLAESIVGYLGGKGGGIVLFPPQISVDFLREVVAGPNNPVPIQIKEKITNKSHD